ncbi:hypothetical protein [Leptospira kirschneri]|uniref:Uncharacterized protein n=1 Tax=Leptospira kirschneri str. H1 TaxID=1049966 RepID=A0A0E2B6G3_9LEPT|nr:hypothetical protein [Leptospira kirschneri]EKO16920.1 hypothetical protein LEP1GSC081_0332 [Leptospira kirschneri str. H1]EMO80416.1 hypothetical protein LEP1GSC126_2965 [Leptospira kirschneri str. 200801774]UML82325.1 hypothetical protein FH602_21025 [Leptospira kirschneri]
MVFLSESNEQRAILRASEELSLRGWRELIVQKSKVISDQVLSTDDEKVKGAFLDAQSSGIGILLYENPIEPN